MIENNERNNLNNYLNKWIIKKIETELSSLIELKNIKEENPELRALAYRLYENNGVIKRSNISEYIKKINQDDRKKLRKLGVKFGRYHIFLFKLFKPSSVSLRILLLFETKLLFITIFPLSGTSKPAISRKAVVLPQPDGPRRHIRSPFSIVRLNLSRTFC